MWFVIDEILFGRDIVCNDVQPMNAFNPIDVTPFSMVNVFNKVHDSQSDWLIVWTVDGIVNDVNLEHDANAYSPIVKTVFGITIVCNFAFP